MLGGAVEDEPVERGDGVASGVVIDKVMLGGAVEDGPVGRGDVVASGVVH